MFAKWRANRSSMLASNATYFNKQTNKNSISIFYTATPGGGGGIDVAVVALSSGDAFVFDLLRFCSLVCSLDSFSIVDDLCVSR